MNFSSDNLEAFSGLKKEHSDNRPQKKRWVDPELAIFGNIAEITQGGPPGTGDSGATALTQSPNFS